jgi:hypothetical protein
MPPARPLGSLFADIVRFRLPTGLVPASSPFARLGDRPIHDGFDHRDEAATHDAIVDRRVCAQQAHRARRGDELQWRRGLPCTLAPIILFPIDPQQSGYRDLQEFGNTGEATRANPVGPPSRISGPAGR